MVIALLVVAFFWVDRKVARRLNDPDNSELTAIYTDRFVLYPQVPLKIVLDELVARGYAETAQKPKSAGEFQRVEGGLNIFLRAFDAGDGQHQDSGLVNFPPDAEAAPPALEPMMLAPLIAGEQRAHLYTPLAKIPDKLQKAVIAIEDERFYQHHGIDIIGIMRAMFVNVTHLALMQGGSTLTQQLAKNTLFSPQRTLSRKFLEMLAAVSLETRLTKAQVLEMYLNEVYLGQEGSVAIHGVSAAARNFFGKPLEELTLGEQALLAGIIQAPSAFSPRRHLDRALERRRSVLDKMHELSFISADEAARAAASKPAIVESSQFERQSPYFVEAVRRSLGETVDIESAAPAGLRIMSGLSPGMQHCAEQAVEQETGRIERAYPAVRKAGKLFETALVAIDPQSGLVRAWVGGRSYRRNQFDHVDMSQRQVGSTIKPFVYLTALDRSLNSYKVAKTTSVLSDEPLRISSAGTTDWTPENYDHQYRGDVTLRYALEQSLNLPAVSVTQKVGSEAVARTVRLFGVADQVPAVPSLGLGALDTSLLRLTAAYGALANGGFSVKPRLFYRATLQGDDVAQNPFVEQRIASEDAVYVLTNILQGVVERGTARGVRSAGYTGVVAGKTGTSDQARDSWFIGFSPDLVVGVWAGMDDNRPMGLTGAMAAVPVWTKFMQCAAPYHQNLDFVPPPGVAFVELDARSRKLATSHCPQSDRVTEVFVRGTEPVEPCPFHSSEPAPALPAIDSDREYPDAADEQTAPRRHRRGLWDTLFN